MGVFLLCVIIGRLLLGSCEQSDSCFFIFAPVSLFPTQFLLLLTQKCVYPPLTRCHGETPKGDVASRLPEPYLV